MSGTCVYVATGDYVCDGKGAITDKRQAAWPPAYANPDMRIPEALQPQKFSATPRDPLAGEHASVEAFTSPTPGLAKKALPSTLQPGLKR